jgi:asparagine synthase (glutamine-hydrolysing)
MDLLTYLPDDLLVKADRASMSFGLELREPMLDNELIEWELQLPISHRFDRRTRRSKLMTRAMAAAKIGQGHFDRPKQGFTPPMVSWLKGPLQSLMQEAVSALESGKLSPLALPNGCRSWSDCEARLDDVHSQFSWRLLCFFLWRKSAAAQ